MSVPDVSSIDHYLIQDVTDVTAVEISPGTVRLTWHAFATMAAVGAVDTGGPTWVINSAKGRRNAGLSLLKQVSPKGTYDGDPQEMNLTTTSFTTDLPVAPGWWYAFQVKRVGSQRDSPVVWVRTAGPAPEYSDTVEPSRVAPFPRWRFQSLDGRESYTFAMNPKTETSPVAQRVLRYEHGLSGFSGVREGRSPVQYSFDGIMHDPAQHQAMQRWLASGSRIKLITDLGEVHIVRLLTYSPTLEAPGQTRTFNRRTYKVDCLLYDEIPSAIGP